LDPNFSADRIVFNGQELMNLINSDKLKKGSVVIFEEAGIGMSSKNWKDSAYRPEKELKTLDEHDRGRMVMHQARLDAMKPHPNGIACPDCGEELWDSDPSIVLTSNPPKKYIHCDNCTYKGYALC